MKCVVASFAGHPLEPASEWCSVQSPEGTRIESATGARIAERVIHLLPYHVRSGQVMGWLVRAIAEAVAEELDRRGVGGMEAP